MRRRSEAVSASGIFRPGNICIGPRVGKFDMNDSGSTAAPNKQMTSTRFVDASSFMPDIAKTFVSFQ